MFYVAQLFLTKAFALVILLQNSVAPDQAVSSFYGEPFHGRLTASGFVYDMEEFTCAHKTLPLGSLVLFFNWETMRFALARITDRGPYITGRDFDLSVALFRHLTDGDMGRGLVTLNYVIIGRDVTGMRYNLGRG